MGNVLMFYPYPQLRGSEWKDKEMKLLEAVMQSMNVMAKSIDTERTLSPEAVLLLRLRVTPQEVTKIT